MRKRQDKDTLFTIRGRVVRRQDVEHYWRRKRLKPADLPPVPTTPDGVSYRTPSPFRTSTSPAIETEHVAPDELDLSRLTQEQMQSFQGMTQELLLTPRPGSLRHLSSPEPMRVQDGALHYAKIYFLSCIEVANDTTDYSRSREVGATFFSSAYSALAAIQRGLSQAIIDVALSKMFDFVPHITRNKYPSVLATLLAIIARYQYSARGSSSSTLVMILQALVNRIIHRYHPEDPLVFILRAVIRPTSDTTELLHRLLLVGKDMLALGGGQMHLERAFIFQRLCEIQYEVKGTSALGYARELYQIESTRHVTLANDETLFCLLAAQNALASNHYRSGDLEQAFRLIESGLRRCQSLKDREDQDFFRAEFLQIQGQVNADRGELSAAVESLSQALTFYLKIFGAADSYTIHTAWWLEWALEEKRAESRLVSDARRENCAFRREDGGFHGGEESTGEEEAELSSWSSDEGGPETFSDGEAAEPTAQNVQTVTSAEAEWWFAQEADDFDSVNEEVWADGRAML